VPYVKLKGEWKGDPSEVRYKKEHQMPRYEHPAYQAAFRELNAATTGAAGTPANSSAMAEAPAAVEAATRMRATRPTRCAGSVGTDHYPTGASRTELPPRTRSRPPQIPRTRRRRHPRHLRQFRQVSRRHRARWRSSHGRSTIGVCATAPIFRGGWISRRSSGARLSRGSTLGGN
jgi:hypothetical protein